MAMGQIRIFNVGIAHGKACVKICSKGLGSYSLRSLNTQNSLPSGSAMTTQVHSA